MSAFQPLVIVGASGAGKGTIVKHLLNTFPNLFKLSVSWTTRQPRNGEQNGREYFFVTHDNFNQEIEKDAFIEYCPVHSNIYGTHKSQISDIMAQNKICILEIDIQGAKKVQKIYPDSSYLFISVKDRETLENRLRGRATDSEEQIKQRLETSIKEIKEIQDSNLFTEIQNDNLDDTIANTMKYLQTKYSTIKFEEYKA